MYHPANKEDTGADCVIEHLETETQEEVAKHKAEEPVAGDKGDGGGCISIEPLQIEKGD